MNDDPGVLRIINGSIPVYRRSMERWRNEGHTESEIRAAVERFGEKYAKEACKGMSPLAAKLALVRLRKANAKIIAILFPEQRP